MNTGSTSSSSTVSASPSPLAVVTPHAAPTASFVAVAYGTGPILVDSIRSLVESLAATGVAFEYVVIDNLHPTAATRARHEVLLSTAGVRVVTAGANLGFGGGCELGVLHARGDVIAFVNPDLAFAPGWFEPLVDALDNGVADIAIPVLLDPDGSVQEAGQRLFADGSTRPLTWPPATPGRGDADFASAACWVARRATLERIGGFDPAFHPAYYEDVDLLLRASRMGVTWAIVPESRVTHHRGGSTADRSVADTRPQRATLLERWPAIRWERAHRG